MSRTVTRAAGALLAVAALTACSPVLTDEPYASSDGVQLRWGENASVKGENILVIADAVGGDARVVGGLTNNGTEDAQITFGFTDGDTTRVTVPAGETVLLDPTSGEDVVLADVPVQPGAVVDMTFDTPGLGTQSIAVPVLDGTLAEYADLVP
ncbi:hypothetical protein FH969_02280 [Miniimonas arenae]|uniref:DNA modification methylase n=1 Tax=Miniimonas arenae TaxID=676201 RepID=A0A5C5BG75_9MICO|nr:MULTISPECIES: hypothetical protein [Miniimonas]TNU76725.1 hypothetical protein FH969_02280 [Miniimonas arenae]